MSISFHRPAPTEPITYCVRPCCTLPCRVGSPQPGACGFPIGAPPVDGVQGSPAASPASESHPLSPTPPEAACQLPEVFNSACGGSAKHVCPTLTPQHTHTQAICQSVAGYDGSFFMYSFGGVCWQAFSLGLFGTLLILEEVWISCKSFSWTCM